MESPEEQAATQQAIDRAVMQLSEHFDEVLILCSRIRDGRSEARHIKHGNYYAHIGLARYFLARADEEARIDERSHERP